VTFRVFIAPQGIERRTERWDERTRERRAMRRSPLDSTASMAAFAAREGGDP